MSTAQRFAWLDVISTAGVWRAAMALAAQAEPPTTALALVARIAVVAAVCILAFYYNDLYNFEVPHDVGQLFRRLCRALGLSALILAAVYLTSPTMTLGGNLASYALLLTLGSAPLARRAGSCAGQARALLPARAHTRRRASGRRARVPHPHSPRRGRSPDRRLARPGAGVAAPRLGEYDALAEGARQHRPDRIIIAMPDRRGSFPSLRLVACRIRGVAIEEGTQVFERLTGRLAVESLTPSTLIFGDGFRARRLPLALMRVLSVVIAAGALVDERAALRTHRAGHSTRVTGAGLLHPGSRGAARDAGSG